jgi:hypothetical protein
MGMMDAAALAEICRHAEEICKKYDPNLTCEVFEAEGLGRYASLHRTNVPSEGQVGVFVTGDARRVSQIDLRKLVAELERLEHVWRVFLTFPPVHSLS